jgi:hypothetical protein
MTTIRSVAGCGAWIGAVRPLVVGAVLVTLAAGCTGSASLPLAPATGRVTCKGKPVAGCRVTFTPTGSLASAGARSATAVTAGDGGFALVTDGKPGAAVGEYAVFVGSEDANSPLPGTADENLRLTVTTAANDFPIELTAK